MSTFKSKVRQVEKTVVDVARELGRYPLDAYEFLEQGLSYTVRKIHGPEAPGLRQLYAWLQRRSIDPSDLLSEDLEDWAAPEVVSIVSALGGREETARLLNRHVSGQELCFGLRDLALSRWGLMAPAVLRSWGIRSTLDFGRMVFGLVESGLLRKQPEDRIEDFDNVFDFRTGFTDSYQVQSRDERSPDAEAV